MEVEDKEGVRQIFESNDSFKHLQINRDKTTMKFDLRFSQETKRIKRVEDQLLHSEMQPLYKNVRDIWFFDKLIALTIGES